MASHLSLFTFMRGVPQECPLLMLLSIIAIILANFIDSHKMIKGIQKRDHEIKTVNFADNTTSSKEALPALIGYKRF